MADTKGNPCIPACLAEQAGVRSDAVGVSRLCWMSWHQRGECDEFGLLLCNLELVLPCSADVSLIVTAGKFDTDLEGTVTGKALIQFWDDEEWQAWILAAFDEAGAGYARAEELWRSKPESLLSVAVLKSFEVEGQPSLQPGWANKIAGLERVVETPLRYFDEFRGDNGEWVGGEGPCHRKSFLKAKKLRFELDWNLGLSEEVRLKQERFGGLCESHNVVFMYGECKNWI